MRLTGNLPLVVILGPTASGKTGLAIHLAQALNGEIIGADSRQIYRYMDIGTAKPSPAQMQQVRHHLVNVVNPDENLGLAQYQQLAYAAIDAVHKAGKIPLLVGGTGQYITAVIEGWAIPEVMPNEALRAELEAFAAEFGSVALHQRLEQADPTAAEVVHHRNVRRVIRALEVYLETGTPISELQKKTPPPYRILQYGLTLDRDALYVQADNRFDQMMAVGFLDEVRELLDRGYNRKLPAMSGLGYAQLAAHLLDDLPLAEVVVASKHATHDFIRRQFTWFRGHDQGIKWHDVAQLDYHALQTTTSQWLESGA
jgi:tRNA dimethylallyltransferase